jgi:Fe2+ transport system protein FeoA
MTLDMLAPGQSGRIIKVNGEGAIRLRLLDMGLTPKTTVHVHKAAPMGDPVELHLRGYSLSIRLEEARNIEIEECRV